jgi:hypothetical protein
MRAPERTLCYEFGSMIPLLIGFLTCLNVFFRSRYNLGLEILALRQQLGIMKRKVPRPRLRTQDRIFWVLLRSLWPAWSNVLVIVKPETVVAWHRAWLSFVLAAFAQGQRALAGQRSMPRSDRSSGGW